jgi:hypothetical protein
MRSRDDVSGFVESFSGSNRHIIDFLPEEDAPQRIFAATCLGEALRATGDLAAASDVFAEAAELERSSAGPPATSTGRSRAWSGEPGSIRRAWRSTGASSGSGACRCSANNPAF